jgi:hypothetical protein
MTEFEISEAFLLQEAEEAQRLCRLEASAELSSSTQRANTPFPDPESSHVVRLQDGSLHVCGRHCPFAVPDAFGYCVCPHTGIAVDRAFEPRRDACTGRSMHNSNPDMELGLSFGGVNTKRRDMAKASQTAHAAAKSLGDVPELRPVRTRASAERLAHRSRKGTALAVTTPSAPSFARPSELTSSCTRDLEQTKSLSVLIEEARGVTCKIFKVHSKTSQKLALTTEAHSTVKPELLQGDVLYRAALKRYFKDMASEGLTPSMHDVDNISIAATNVVREEKEKAANEEFQRAHELVKSRTFCMWFSRLAAELWQSVHRTSYFESGKRGTESFRSFVMGVLYATRRGFSLKDGAVLVPQIAEVSLMLSHVRQSIFEPELKTLHGSAHKGMCTLQRAVATVPSHQTKRFFGRAIELAKETFSP